MYTFEGFKNIITRMLPDEIQEQEQVHPEPVKKVPVNGAKLNAKHVTRAEFTF